MAINLLPKTYLDDVRKRCDAATPGPWIAYLEGRDHLSGESFIARGVNRAEEDMYLFGGTDTDIDFVANAKQDIPLLLDEIVLLRRLLEENNAKIGIDLPE